MAYIEPLLYGKVPPVRYLILLHHRSHGQEGRVVLEVYPEQLMGRWLHILVCTIGDSISTCLGRRLLTIPFDGSRCKLYCGSLVASEVRGEEDHIAIVAY